MTHVVGVSNFPHIDTPIIWPGSWSWSQLSQPYVRILQINQKSPDTQRYVGGKMEIQTLLASCIYTFTEGDLVEALTKCSDFSPAISQFSLADSQPETFSLPKDESIAQPSCPPPTRPHWGQPSSVLLLKFLSWTRLAHISFLLPVRDLVFHSNVMRWAQNCLPVPGWRWGPTYGSSIPWALSSSLQLCPLAIHDLIHFPGLTEFI